MRPFLTLGLVTLFAGTGFAETELRPSFDIADVHLSPRSEWVKDVSHALQGGFMIGDRYELHRATLLDLIRIAYDVNADKIFGGPAWIDYDRFEIIAKTTRGTRPAALNAMLQTLLADRFHLTLKREERPVAGFVLSKGKGEPKLKPVEDAGAGYCESLLPNLGGEFGFSTIACHATTMDSFVASLRGALGGPVLNATGLDGAWEFTYQYPAQNPAAGQSPAGVIEALNRLGLKVEPGKVPEPVFTVEKIDDKPSANPPGVSEALPPLPLPRFEVATVRLSGTEDHITTPLRVERGGRVVAMVRLLVG